MSFEDVKYPHRIDNGPNLEIDGDLVAIATSEDGILLASATEANFTIGHDLVISYSEKVGRQLIHRDENNQVVGIDFVGPQPHLFRRSELGIPEERIDEMTRGLKMAGHRYLIVHGEEPGLESFPTVSETRKLQEQR